MDAHITHYVSPFQMMGFFAWHTCAFFLICLKILRFIIPFNPFPHYIRAYVYTRTLVKQSDLPNRQNRYFQELKKPRKYILIGKNVNFVFLLTKS